MVEQAGPYAVIVGAGIGGLAAAVALRQRGWEVTVLERASALGLAGACLGIAPNGLRALDTLGIGDSVRAQASLPGQAGVLRPDGRWLARAGVDAIEARFGDPIVLVYRRDLIDLLASQLPDGTIRLAAQVTGIDLGSAPEQARVTTVGSETIEADLVVGADGLHSIVRQAVFPQHTDLHYVGYTTWRLIAAADSAGEADRIGETWGNGARFAILPLSDGRFYCYATANRPVGQHHDDNRAVLQEIFGTWHQPIPALLAAADPTEIIHTDVRVLSSPLPAFHSQRVALLGDAAHPMTPDLGQGGCQAIEDAVVLAYLLRDTVSARATVPDLLADYTAARRPRTLAVAQRSQRIGKFSQAEGSASAWLRDLTVRIGSVLPPALVARGLDSVLGWQPPA